MKDRNHPVLLAVISFPDSRLSAKAVIHRSNILLGTFTKIFQMLFKFAAEIIKGILQNHETESCHSYLTHIYCQAFP